jgi:hypothetical protein
MPIYEFADTAKDANTANDTEMPLERYPVESLTEMLIEATVEVSRSIERRSQIRRTIEMKHLQMSESVTESDHHMQNYLNPNIGEERPRF